MTPCQPAVGTVPYDGQKKRLTVICWVHHTVSLPLEKSPTPLSCYHLQKKKKFIYFRKFRLGFICLLRVHVGFWSDGLSPAGEQTKQPGPSQQVVRIQGTQTITLASLPEVFPSKRLRGFTTQEGDLCCKPAESHHQEGKGGPHWFGVMQAKKQSKIRSQLCSITLSSSVSCVHTTGWGQQASWGIETSIALDISQTRFISHGLGSHSELFAGPLSKYYRQTQEFKL